ncbi:hypothetical protein IJJ49_01150 [Candidatus Saccharibacteria bacterium]|nr:hypothetical protein [Candidatus Saccharibacteria bacterium]
MPNFENFPTGGEGDKDSGENIPRDIAQERGEKTEAAKARAEAEERERAALEELARLKAERAKILEELGEGTDETETVTSEAPGETSEKKRDRDKTVEKMNQRSGLKKFLTGAAVVVLAGLIAGGAYLATHHDNKDKSTPADPDPAPTTAVETVEEANPLIGELENGTAYDYTHYADRHMEFDDQGNVTAYVTNKEAWNAYDYDYSADFGDRTAAEKGIMEVATRSPEALASYAYSIFTDSEKEELGIAGMSMTEIDDYMSNDAGGGAMQKRLLEKLGAVLSDEKTNFHFYYEDDTEDTNYIYWVDEDGDGEMTPVELHLGYDTRDRNGAPQVDIYRSFLESSDKNGDYYESKKMIDLNMECGYQPNYEKGETPSDVPYVPANQTEPSAGAEGSEPSAGSEGSEPSAGSEGSEPSAGAEGSEPSAGSEGSEPSAGSEGSGSEGTGNETSLESKNPDEEIAHAGDRVDVQDLDEDVTPKTTLEQDQANFDAIEAQRQTDAQAAAEAERVRAEQAEAERQAAAEAEARRQAEADAAAGASAEQAAREAEAQRQANEAAARAAEQAAAEQRAAAEAEQQRAAEEAARQAAQAEADAQAAAAAAEAESNANATAGERADMFNNGDF